MFHDSSEVKFEGKSPPPPPAGEDQEEAKKDRTPATPLTLDEVRSWWEVASIVHFSSVFRPAFELPEFEFDEFEDELMRDKPGEENLFLSYLTIDLLKGCLGLQEITFMNFNDHLKNFIAYQTSPDDNLSSYFDEGRCFSDLSAYDKVCLINRICDYRLTTLDAAEKTADVDAESLRIEPLGTDSKGTTFWYFYGSRLYAEAAPIEKPPHLALKPQSTPVKKSKKKKNKKKEEVKEEAEIDDAFTDWSVPCNNEVFGEWRLVASSLSEWESLAETYRDSKRSRDQELFSVINENFLPILPSVIEAEEKSRVRRVHEMESTRQSRRLEEKRKEKELQKMEEEEARRAEEQEKREALKVLAREEEQRKAELANQERLQREEAKAVLRDERQKRVAMREERIALIREGKPLPPYLMGTSCDSPATSPAHSSFEDSLPNGAQSEGKNGRVDEALNSSFSSGASKWRGRKRGNQCELSGSSADEDSLDEDEVTTGILKVLSEIESHQDSHVFLDPVTDEIAPGYSSVIKNPICLQDMYKKLRYSNYHSINAFVQDGLRMFENCWQYNGRNSEFGKIAINVSKVFANGCRKHLGVECFFSHGKRRMKGKGKKGKDVSDINPDLVRLVEEVSKPKKPKTASIDTKQGEEGVKSEVESQRIPTYSSGYESGSKNSDKDQSARAIKRYIWNQKFELRNQPLTPDRRKQNLSSKLAVNRNISSSPSAASEEVKMALNGTPGYRSGSIGRLPNYKREVRLPSMYLNKQSSFRGYPPKAQSTPSRYGESRPPETVIIEDTDNDAKNQEVNRRTSRENNKTIDHQPDLKHLGNNSSVINQPQKQQSGDSFASNKTVVVQYSNLKADDNFGNASYDRYNDSKQFARNSTGLQLGFNGSPSHQNFTSSQHIIAKQSKGEELTVRLQQHTQETVNNFLRVTNNAANNSVKLNPARVDLPTGQKSPSFAPKELQFNVITNPGISIKRPVPVSFSNSNNGNLSQMSGSNLNASQFGPTYVAREETVVDQSNLRAQLANQNRSQTVYVSQDGKVNATHPVISAIPVKFVTNPQTGGHNGTFALIKNPSGNAQIKTFQPLPANKQPVSVQNFINANTSPGARGSNPVSFQFSPFSGKSNFNEEISNVNVNNQNSPVNKVQTNIGTNTNEQQPKPLLKFTLPQNATALAGKKLAFAPINPTNNPSAASNISVGTVKQMNIINPTYYNITLNPTLSNAIPSSNTSVVSSQSLISYEPNHSQPARNTNTRIQHVSSQNLGFTGAHSKQPVMSQISPGHKNQFANTILGSTNAQNAAQRDPLLNSTHSEVHFTTTVPRNATTQNSLQQGPLKFNGQVMTATQNSVQSSNTPMTIRTPSGAQLVFNPLTKTAQRAVNNTAPRLPLSSPQPTMQATSCQKVSDATRPVATMQTRVLTHQISSTSQETAKNSKAISTNQHLPLSGKPTTAKLITIPLDYNFANQTQK